MKKYYTYFLLGIFLLASFLRLWQIGQVPLSPDWDEVALGYNAYSILHTGKDEYRKPIPFVLKSFDDYKPALYTYLIIPFLPIFDLSVVAVRLPSVLFGIATVIATYFLVLELFKRKGLALVSSFLLAISPWHIQFSRVGFEANVGVAFNVFTALFFLKGLKKPWYLFVAIFFAGMNIYVYQSEKLFVPIFLLILIGVYGKQLIKLPKKFLIGSGILLTFLIIPMLLFTLLSPQGLARARSTSIFSQELQDNQSLQERIQQDIQHKDSGGKLFDNKLLFYTKHIIKGYLMHYDPNWLFIKGDISRHHAPHMGLLYLVELPFLLIGLYVFLFVWLVKAKEKRNYLFLLFWFLAAPLPASITLDIPHAVRTMNFLPTYQVFIAIGIVWSIIMLRQKIRIPLIRYSVYSIMGILALFNFVYYLNQYFVQLNKLTASDWQYGYQELVPTVEKLKANYGNVVVSTISPMDQSYIFFLFYSKYPPAKYQEETSGVETHNFDKYQFRVLNWEQDKNNKGILYVGAATQFPPDVKALKTIYYPDGQPAMRIVTP